ncbi:15263_t:CDS:2 [Cetraspora pellucida]|uniref:15263_t:CDS:1 n=1 Tax=Cetraspora pellucida TaxID=1433469 RepID=A0A9N9CM64_9GLOM|nr:15263_t:CDS:2 [Cetraspora pellucida]
MSLDNANSGVIDASNVNESTNVSLVPAKWGTFVPYESIENSYNLVTINHFTKEDVWIATEKIHGANFSFFTNGHEIKCARRNGFIAPDEDFYNYQSMLAKYTLQILSLHKLMLSKNLIRGEMIIIYGELFGGKYPHPDITKDVKEKSYPIQRGVFYSPKIEFIAFDLFDGVDLLDFDIMKELLKVSDIPYLKPLIKDSYKNVIQFDPNFTTTIPKLLGYPTPLPPPFDKNMAEGIVIKPAKNIRTSKRHRVILKIKASDFDERKKNPDKSNKKRRVTSFDKIIMDLSEFINMNRLNSVISKQNTKDKNDEMKMVELLYEDAMKDFMKDEQLKKKFLKLSDNIKEKVKKNGISKANQVVNKHLMSLYND